MLNILGAGINLLSTWSTNFKKCTMPVARMAERRKLFRILYGMS